MRPFNNHRRCCAIETLERRCLLSNFAHISHTGTLLVSGTDAADTIAVSSSGDQIVAELSSSRLQFAAAQVRRVSIDASGGDDTVRNATALTSTILGGDGNDLLFGGQQRDFIVQGDSIVGGAGNDTINSEGGRDIVWGGDGTDMWDFSDRKSAASFGIGTLDADPSTPNLGIGAHGRDDSSDGENCEIVNGTPHNDEFTANSTVVASTTSIDGQLVTVTLRGGGGDDIFEVDNDNSAYALEGGAGRDAFKSMYETYDPSLPSATPTLLGGPGNDYFEYPGGWSADGGPGGDTIDLAYFTGTSVSLSDWTSIEHAINIGSNGPTKVIGTGAANYLACSTPHSPMDVETIIGNGGNDTIIGNAEADYLSGGDGDDLVEGGGGADTIFGGDGNDVLAGNSGNDKIHGLFGNDTIIGQSGRDRLYGDDGDDLLIALDHQRDTVYGGAGMDSAYVDNSAKVKDLWDQIEKIL